MSSPRSSARNPFTPLASPDPRPAPIDVDNLEEGELVPFVPRDPRDEFRAHSSDLYDAIDDYIRTTNDESVEDFAAILRAKVDTHLDAMVMMFNCEHVRFYKAEEELERQKERASELEAQLKDYDTAMAETSNITIDLCAHIRDLGHEAEAFSRKCDRLVNIPYNGKKEREKKRALAAQLKEMRKKQRSSE